MSRFSELSDSWLSDEMKERKEEILATKVRKVEADGGGLCFLQNKCLKRKEKNSGANVCFDDELRKCLFVNVAREQRKKELLSDQ